MDILFGRHGNTFGPDDKVVWVGRETDLELVDKGWQQAKAFHAALLRLNMVPDRLYCASLKRTRGFAETIGKNLPTPIKPVIESRLDEVDYGAWAGKTSEEISTKPEDKEAMEHWSRHDIWPSNAGWGSLESEILGNIQGFIDDILLTAHPDQKLLVISSNGTLRFFPKLLQVSNRDLPSYVMKTGHIGLISGTPGAFKVRFWNIKPESLGTE
ncbi:MAG: histidine phosphatase family protein [Rhodospirillaceae bacterium]